MDFDLAHSRVLPEIISDASISFAIEKYNPKLVNKVSEPGGIYFHLATQFIMT